MDLTALPAVAVLGVLAYHLWQAVDSARESPWSSAARDPGDSERNELLRTKRQLLEALQEIDLDHQVGKLDRTDHESLSKEVRVRVVDVMKRVDALDKVDERGARIEDELSQRLAGASPSPSGLEASGRALFCGGCGRRHAAGDRFCQGCGEGLSPACGGCGADVLPDSRFCKHCGEAVA